MNTRIVILAVSLSLLPALSLALELGFESALFFEESRSDSAVPGRAPSGVDGTLGVFSFSLFGQQQTERIDAGFLAELRAEQQVDSNEDATIDETFTRFYGGLTAATPIRSLNWYVGDALANVLSENQLQSIDDSGERQLNIFVTGPEISTQVGIRKTLDLSLYYAHLSDDTDTDLDTLYRFSADFVSELSGGRTWGIQVSDIYTQKPDTAINSEDYNRASVALIVERQNSPTQLNGELGATQYYSNGDSTNGLRAGLGWSRTLSPTSSLSITLGHDLIDQTLGILQDLTTGQAAREEANGVAAETSLDLLFQSRSEGLSFYAGLGAQDSNFQLVTNQSGFTSRNTALRDNRVYRAHTGLSSALTPRLGFFFDVDLQSLEFVNRPDEVESLSFSARFNYALNNRWSVELGGRYLESEGATTTIDDSSGTISDSTEIDSSDSRVFIGLRWAPPTRASRTVGGVVKSFL